MDYKGDEYYIGRVHNHTDEAKIVEIIIGADYTSVFGFKKFTLAPGETEYSAAKKNVKGCAGFTWEGLFTIEVSPIPAVVVPGVPGVPVVPVVPVALTKEQIVAKVLAKNAD